MKEERRKKGQTNNKAKQDSTPKAVTFPKKNELPWVGLESTTLYTLDRALYHCSTLPLHYQGNSAWWAQISYLMHAWTHPNVANTMQNGPRPENGNFTAWPCHSLPSLVGAEVFGGHAVCSAVKHSLQQQFSYRRRSSGSCISTGSLQTTHVRASIYRGADITTPPHTPCFHSITLLY